MELYSSFGGKSRKKEAVKRKRKDGDEESWRTRLWVDGQRHCADIGDGGLRRRGARSRSEVYRQRIRGHRQVAYQADGEAAGEGRHHCAAKARCAGAVERHAKPTGSCG